MTNSKTTKRALFSSVMALLLCFTMLLGTTFAWFTDTASSATNKIVAGNLDVELYHADKAQPTDTAVDSNTKLFDDVTLWEPGAMVWEKFKVTNAGNLALKYVLSVNITDISEVNNKSLADVLKVAVLDVQPTRENVAAAAIQPLATFNLKSDQPLAAGASEEAYVAIYWAPSENDNDYNVKDGALNAKLGVTLMATQYTSESDSFDNQYDKDATYESVATPNHTCEYDSDNTCTICGITKIAFKAEYFDTMLGIDIATATNVEIPETFEHDGKEYKVTSVSMGAFAYNTTLESIVIPETVTSIGMNAFYGCSSLKSVTISNGVTTIGTSAFAECNSLENIILPDSVTKINGNAFRDCTSLKTITIPAGLVSVGNTAFGNCTSLTTVNFKGSAEQWANITIDGGNDYLKNATINCAG